jgi:methylglutaconyl-CoA hydratase
MEYQSIRVDRHPGQEDRVVRITLARPDVHNAFDAGLIRELTHALREAGGVEGARAVVLRGEGRNFSAGADIHWMRSSLDRTEEENLEDARRMQEMFRAFAECRLPVVGRIHGVALGGGTGLTAACDIALAHAGARFGFTEVRLGILPAVISPFVLRKIGPGPARHLFLTGERFDAARAYEIGLVQGVYPDDGSLDQGVDGMLDALLACAPGALARVKRLLLELEGQGPDDRYDLTARTIAEVRVGEEAQAGLRAFLDKQAPPWMPAKEDG